MSAGTQGGLFLSVGHITADVAPDGDVTPGGAVTYAAAAAAALGWRVRVLTAGGEEFGARPPFPAPLGSHIEWHARPSPSTTTFVNRYDAQGHRTQELLALARPLDAVDVPKGWRTADVVHLAPVAGELTEGILAGVSCRFLGVTPQGWLRSTRVGAPVTPQGPGIPEAVLAAASAVVVSEEDLAGSPWSPDGLAPRTRLLAVTRGADGAYILTGRQRYAIAGLPVAAVDPTGAGDVFATSLFVQLAEAADLATALRFATVAAGCAVARRGLEGIALRAEVERRLASAPEVVVTEV